MNRSTIYNDLAQLWLEIDVVQSLYFEPGRVSYRLAMQSAGADAAITADPTQVSFSADLVVSVPGELDDTTDTELADLISGHLLAVVTALSFDGHASQRLIDLFSRLCASSLPVVSGVSIERARQQVQREQLGRLLNIAAFYQLATAIVEHDYQDKQSAHNNRVRFAELGLTIQHALSLTNDLVLYQQVTDLIAIVGDAYRGFSTELRPVAYYSPPADLSVLAAAWNLYRDPTWCDDLVARNHSASSLLLKQPVEYLVPDDSDRIVR